MDEDPIVTEVHRIRQEITAEFNHDLEAYFRYVQARGAEARKRGVPFIDTPFPDRRAAKPDAA